MNEQIRPFELKIRPLDQHWRPIIQRRTIQPIGQMFGAVIHNQPGKAGIWQGVTATRTSNKPTTQADDNRLAAADGSSDGSRQQLAGGYANVEGQPGPINEAAAFGIDPFRPSAKVGRARLGDVTIPALLERERVEDLGRNESSTASHMATQTLIQQARQQAQPSVLGNATERFLANRLGMQLGAVKFYADRWADRLTNRLNVDAVTIGEQIFFRAGHFAPQQASGVALLAHELTHVAHQRGKRPALLDPLPGLEGESEESVARHTERVLLAELSEQQASPWTVERALTQQTSQPPTWSQPIVPNVAGRHVAGPVATSAYGAALFDQHHSPSSLPTPAAKPAASNRDLEMPRQQPPTIMPPAELSSQQLRTIKEEVYRDLLARLRSEFERGA